MSHPSRADDVASVSSATATAPMATVISRTAELSDDVAEEVLPAEETTAVATLPHVQQYRLLQQAWQSHDAYARVSMSYGTTLFVQALGYYFIGYTGLQLELPWVAIVVAAFFSCLALLFSQLDMVIWVANKSFEISKFKFKISESSNLRTC